MPAPLRPPSEAGKLFCLQSVAMPERLTTNHDLAKLFIARQ
jgi:hypothetical protein